MVLPLILQGKGIANPLATILSVAMMLRYSLDQENVAMMIEKAVADTLAQGLRTKDIACKGETGISTEEMGEAVIRNLHKHLT